MNTKTFAFISAIAILTSCQTKQEPAVQEAKPITKMKLFLDVHDIGPGKVNPKDVADAHKKDLATQGEFNTNFIKYWVDEEAGKVYCLAEAPADSDVYNTHSKAHGLLPDKIMEVTGGEAAALTGRSLFLDVHHLEPGGVTPEEVAEAHKKDLAVQGKYDVSFINYWFDHKSGTVYCLSEAPDSVAIIKTHTEAHGLIPAAVERVIQGE